MMEEAQAVALSEGGQSAADLVCGATSAQSVSLGKRKRLDGSTESVEIRSPREETRGIGEDLMVLISQEKEKKRMTLALANSLLEVKRRYEEVIDEAMTRADRMEGRWTEASLQLDLFRKSMVEKSWPGNGKEKKEREGKEEKGSEEADEGSPMEVEATKEKKKRKKRKKNKEGGEREGQVAVPVVKATVPAAASYASVAAKGGEGGKFTVVERKKKKEKAEEKLKGKRPATAFIVEKGEGTSKEARDRLWSKIVSKVRAPQVGLVKVLPRGDILIKPADEATKAALVEIVGEDRSGVRKEEVRRPRVMIYDVERSVGPEEIGEALARQNPSLGVDAEHMKAAVKPLFMRGPREDPLVRWICEVDSAIYRKLVKKRWFLGLGLCKIVDFTEVIQCFACQGFGHAEAKCKRGKVVCSHCAVEGHRQKDCGEKGKAPKCVNCGLSFTAGHSSCPVRRRYERNCLIRTDYGSSSQ